MRAWPIPGTLVPLHGTNPPRGEVFLSQYTLEGAPMTSDPRHALKAQVDALAADGLYPAGAFELEFFLLANDRDADGRVRPARMRCSMDAATRTRPRSIRSTTCTAWSRCFPRSTPAAAKAGIKAETVISEYRAGPI